MLNVQVLTAYVVDSLIVHQEGTVGVLQGGVGSEDGVVGLNYCGGHLYKGKVYNKITSVNGAVFHEC